MEFLGVNNQHYDPSSFFDPGSQNIQICQDSGLFSPEFSDGEDEEECEGAPTDFDLAIDNTGSLAKDQKSQNDCQNLQYNFPLSTDQVESFNPTAFLGQFSTPTGEHFNNILDRAKRYASTIPAVQLNQSSQSAGSPPFYSIFRQFACH